jgi:dihydrofolate reductase
MKVSMILAVDQNGLIGCSNNTLPWSDKEDMAWFKKNTLDKAVLDGNRPFYMMKNKLKYAILTLCMEIQ